MCSIARAFLNAMQTLAALSSKRHSIMWRHGLTTRPLLAAKARHELVLIDGMLKIKLKRVDLLNCDAAFGNIQLFL